MLTNPQRQGGNPRTKGKTMNVVPLDPDCKPHVGSMNASIKRVIEDYTSQNQVTLAEAIGTLEIIKQDYILDALEG